MSISRKNGNSKNNSTAVTKGESLHDSEKTNCLIGVNGIVFVPDNRADFEILKLNIEIEHKDRMIELLKDGQKGDRELIATLFSIINKYEND